MAPEEVPGAVSGSKAEPKGGKNGSIDFLGGPLGALPGLRGPLARYPVSLTLYGVSPREPGTGAEGPWGDKGG